MGDTIGYNALATQPKRARTSREAVPFYLFMPITNPYYSDSEERNQEGLPFPLLDLFEI